MVPLLIMATSLVSKINTSVALLKGWVNSFLAFMGQLYLGFYRRGGAALWHAGDDPRVCVGGSRRKSGDGEYPAGSCQLLPEFDRASGARAWRSTASTVAAAVRARA